MKNKKVLIGLIVAAFVGGAHFASAQPKANYQNQLIEIGPDNIGGRVRSIVVDKSVPGDSVLYAGGVAGGLYKKVGAQAWEYIPYTVDGREVTLPISYMLQLPNNQILIATGEGFVENHGLNNDRMAPRGRGLFLFNPEDNSFYLLPATDPTIYDEWAYINKMACIERANNLYVYVTTPEGFYYWVLDSYAPDWTSLPVKAKSGNFHDVEIVSADNMVYATTPNKVYRIGNLVAQSPMVDITNSNSAFATASRIELASNTSHEYNEATGSYDHTTYLYAVVTNAQGTLDAVYLTTNQQTWSRLTTSTIVPFTTVNPGSINSAIVIDPTNYKRILIGGATVWVGEGFVDGGYYQWTKSSYSEEELNAGNYMSEVFSTSYFVHSGIHQIVPALEMVDGDSMWVYYFATDGGIYKSIDNEATAFAAYNKGFNTVQFNSITVAPDGSILGGAMDNSCPFIQSRNAHNGGTATNEWYDSDTNSNMNHLANILWMGNGGGVASSRFQQVLPLSMRGYFFSAEPGHLYYNASMSGTTPTATYGRAFGDYADYTNTQTWNSGTTFLSDAVPNSNPIPQMYLWETTNNTHWNDSITFTLDTMAILYRGSEEIQMTGATQIQAGDQVIVPSPGHFHYPFRHTFTESFTARDKMSHRVHNPIANHLLINGRTTTGRGAAYLNFTPTDYRKQWDPNEAASNNASVIATLMNWSKIYEGPQGYTVGALALNQNSDAAYIYVSNDTTGEGFIFRVYNLNDVDVNDPIETKSKLEFCYDWDGMSRVTLYDTIWASDGDWFKRPVTSIFVDQRDGEKTLLITFGGYDTTGMPNLVMVKNPDDTNTRTVTDFYVTNSACGMTAGDPIYSALIEYTTGKVYVGTEKGVFTTDSLVAGAAWESFGAFEGVPVTSIVQQTNALPRQRFEVHEGIKTETYLFAKTKYPYAIYFGTYGRGVFMDTTYVTDHVNEIVDEEDFVGITTVDNGDNHIQVYPNPANTQTTIEMAVSNAGNAMLKVYDLSGKTVMSQNLGFFTEGVHYHTLDCGALKPGMYLINITFGQQAATSKLIVR